jgi:hypothetical protein
MTLSIGYRLGLTFAGLLLLAYQAARLTAPNPGWGQPDARPALDTAQMRAVRDSLRRDSVEALVARPRVRKRHPRTRRMLFDEPTRNARYRVLLTGDSMGDALFMAWRKQRRQGRFDLRYAPWYGSTTKNWATSNQLADLITNYDPDLVVFSLGSNELLNHRVQASEPYVKEILRQLGSANYVWVGPPNWQEDTGINRLIAKHVPADRFFVSKDLALARRDDGVHLTFEAGQAWADTIGRWVERRPAYRFSFGRAPASPRSAQ